MKRILISGYYGYSNSGDDAILTSICQDIRQIGNHEITILSDQPETTQKEFKVNALDRFKFWTVRRAILESDLILMGGGSLLQDGTSSRSLYYYLFIIWYAKRHHKKCILYANGIGPIHKRFNQWITKKIANKVDVITLREGLSMKVLKEIGVVKPPVYITADPVFNIPRTKVDVKELLRKESVDLSKPLVAVLFRDWGETTTYAQQMGQLCDTIIDTYDVNILLIPMKYPSDIKISKDIQSHMKRPSYLLMNKYDAPTIIEIIGASQLVLAMRLHALLYSALLSIPMIGFSYDPKIDYYLKELDMFCAGNIHNISMEEVLEEIKKIWAQYPGYQEHLHEKTNVLIQKALMNREILAKLLNDEK